MRLRDLSHVPPKGWIYTQPETNFEIRGGDFWDLRRKVLDHRLNNGIMSGPEIDNDIHAQICERSPSFCAEPDVPDTKRQLNASDVVQFLRTMKTWLLKKPEFVPQAEADRRASICAGCPNNVPVVGCVGCAGVPGVLMQVVGNRRTSSNDRLLGCFICGCSLPAVVWAPLEILPEHKNLPAFCWQHDKVKLDHK